MQSDSRKQITLSQGEVAIVDDEDYELVSAYKWHVSHNRSNKYARSMSRPGIYMHRLVLGLTDGSVMVDHINRDGLDNRRCNLRVCTTAQNAGHSALQRNNTSGFRGVRMAYKGKWAASIGKSGGYLGTFSSKEEAARAYDAAAIERFGEFASLNFPEDRHVEGL